MSIFSTNRPLIYLITEGTATIENFSASADEILETIRLAAAAKIPLIQIREKKLPAKLIFKLACEAVKLTSQTETKILVNDRADIAFAANADGVHLTANSLRAEIVRRNFPKDFIVGVSTHTLEEAQAAQSQNADFVTFGPVFQTPSKEIYGAPQGLEKLRVVCEKLDSFPVVALGGINENNFAEVFQNGAKGFAAIRFLNELVKDKNAEVLKSFE